LPLNIPKLPFGLGGISANLRVIEPPVTAAGPARQLSSKPDTWQTSATSAQVRLTLALQIKADILKPVIDANLNVPLFLDVANATADLTRLQCAANPADRRATMQVKSGLATACLTDGCTGGEVVLGEAKLGLLDIAEVVATDVPRYGNTAGQEITLAPGGHVQVGMADPFGGLFSQALSLKVRTKLLGVLSLPLDLGPVLAPLGATLDGLVPPLLNSLGIQLGTADLWLHSIDCNNAELVY